MSPIILFREELGFEEELIQARNYFDVTSYRSIIPAESLVIGRYSVLPFYRELETELSLNKSSLINSYSEHSFMANVEAWAGEGCPLYGLTPKTWNNWSNLSEGSYVLKGRTNSRKQRWNTHMFAASLSDVPKVASRLWDDTLISDQGIVIREYIPLKKINEGLNGIPIANEHRTFWLTVEENGIKVPKLLTSGFYWAGSHPELESESKLTLDGFKLAEQAAKILSEYITFFVLDVAETESGQWIVIEVNDGQMSGLSGCSAEELYFNLKKLV